MTQSKATPRSTDDDIQSLESALEEARQRITALEARLEAEMAAKSHDTAWLYATLEQANIGIWQWDVTRDEISWNDAVYRLYGVPKETFVPHYEAYLRLLHDEDRELVMGRVQTALSTGQRDYIVEHRVQRPDGTVRWVTSYGVVSYGEDGKPTHLSGAILDMTERKLEEQARLAMQQRIIDAQKDTLRELGAPIIPLRDKTLAMPLIGAFTRERADQVMESLLFAVGERRAQVVLIDVTGVPEVDTSAAEALVRAAAAVRLLGAVVVLTGIRPQVAQTLVKLGVDLRGFTTVADLQSGIEYAGRLLDKTR